MFASRTISSFKISKRNNTAASINNAAPKFSTPIFRQFSTNAFTFTKFNNSARFYSTEAKPASTSAQLLKQVRDRTGAGIMDCKKALVNNNNDVEKAIAELVATARLAQGKTGRVTLQGILSTSAGGNCGVITELSCETDFVAKNELFKSLSGVIANAALSSLSKSSNASTPSHLSLSIDNVKNEEIDNVSVNTKISEAIYSIKENISITRAEGVYVSNGVVGGYSHHGRIAALVALKASNPSVDSETLAKLAKDLALHVVASTPKVISTATAEMSKEDVLLEQSFFVDEDITVKQALEKAGADVTIDSVLFIKRGEEAILLKQ